MASCFRTPFVIGECTRVPAIHESPLIDPLCFSVPFRRFFKHYHDSSLDVNGIVSLFRDTHRTWLKNISIRNSLINDNGLKVLLRHNLKSLSLWYCDNITRQSYHNLLEHASELEHLELGRNVDMLKHGEPNEKSPFNFQLSLPRLQSLTMIGVVLQPTVGFEHLLGLSHLNLTGCILADFSLLVLTGLPCLHTLILFNVWPLEKEWPYLCQMNRLEFLDISVASPSGHGIYKDPDLMLASLVESLPMLTHLDISGTNLAGRGVAKKQSNGSGRNSDIPGLVSRVERPLEFLGLYNTAHSASRRHDIPALNVSRGRAEVIEFCRSTNNTVNYLRAFRLRARLMRNRSCYRQ